jgi:hypothetical protein
MEICIDKKPCPVHKAEAFKTEVPCLLELQDKRQVRQKGALSGELKGSRNEIIMELASGSKGKRNPLWAFGCTDDNLKASSAAFEMIQRKQKY